MSDNIEGGPYFQLFLGECYGVGLKKRGENDNHICFTILVEDDERWFPSSNPGSSHWVDDLITQLTLAKAWMKLKGEPDEYDTGIFGYVLKEGQ